MSQAGSLNGNGGGGGGTADIQKINVQTGTSPVVTANNTITFNGAVVAAGSNPVRTDGTAPATMALEVQTAQAIASTDATAIGLAAFDSADFSVDANGFVQFTGGGGGGITTIDGDTSSVTGSTISIISNVASAAAGSTVLFSGDGATTLTYSNTDSSSNVAIGNSAGVGLTGDHCTFLGVQAGENSTSTSYATMMGDNAGNDAPLSNFSVFIGGFCGNTAPCVNATIVGFAGGYTANGADNSTFIGYRAGQAASTSVNCTYLGYQAGFNASGNTSCIYIGDNVAASITSETGAIRIGTAGTQNTCFVAGITGVAPTSGNTPQVTLCDNTGKLTTISSSTSGFVLTSNGTATPSFQAGVASVTIDGDTGSAAGGTITLNAQPNAGGSVKFTASGSTVLLKTSDSLTNTFIGSNSGNTSVTGTVNTAFGGNTLTLISSGATNTAIGKGCLNNLSTGNANTALGYSCSTGMTSGSNNIIIGNIAGSGYTTSESNNICIGHAGVTGESTVTRIGTALSQDSCYIAGIAGVSVSNTNMVTIDTTTGQMGSQAVPSGTVTTIAGDSGSATGSTITFNAQSNAGSSVTFSASGSTVDLNVTDGSNNIFIGSGAGSATPGNSHTAVGYQALHNLNGSNFSTAFGFQALKSITTNNACDAFGSSTLTACTGPGNCAFAGGAGQNLTTGQLNCFIGASSFFSCVTGSFNIGIGVNSGTSYTSSESSNIIIGNTGTVSESNVLRIGTQGSSSGQQSTCFIAGITGATVTGSAVLCSTAGQLGTIASSIIYKENINPIDSKHDVLKLNPVTFNYKSDSEKTTHFGLIAEEVEKVMPELVLYGDDGRPESVAYHEMPALLLAEIKKLRSELDELKARMA